MCILTNCERQSIEKHFGVRKDHLIEAEFAVFSELDFSLTVPLSDLLPQFTRLLSVLDTVPLVCEDVLQ